MRRILLSVLMISLSISFSHSQSTLQNITATLKELPIGAMDPSFNVGDVITCSALNNMFFVYPGSTQQIDIGNVVYYFGYNTDKHYYDGLTGVETDQEIINGPAIHDANGNVQFASNGEVMCEKMVYSNKITILGKMNILAGYITIAIRYESSDQIDIFFYNYDTTGTLLSSFLAACNEKEQVWETKGGVASVHSLMKATINSDKTITVFTDGDFMLEQKFQLTSDGHFRVIYEKKTEYPD